MTDMVVQSAPLGLQHTVIFYSFGQKKKSNQAIVVAVVSIPNPPNPLWCLFFGVCYDCCLTHNIEIQLIKTYAANANFHSSKKKKRYGCEASLWRKPCLRKFNQANTREKEDQVVCVVQRSEDTHRRLAELVIL